MRGQDFRKENLRVDFRDAVPVMIHLEDMREALLVELKEAVHLVPGAVAGLDREPIGADRSQEYRMEFPAHIFIDDGCGMVEGSRRRRHERSDVFHTEDGAAPFDAFDGLLITVMSWPGPVLVVQESRTVEGGGHLHPFIAEIQKYVVRHARKIGADNDIKILPSFTGLLLGSRNDVLDHVKGEQRFSPLKLKRHG